MMIAVIDIGTNTFNLLIGEYKNGTINRVFEDKSAVMLGMDGINNGEMSSSAITRAQTAIDHFVLSISKYAVVKTIAVGTSALRNAKNAQVLIDYAESKGIEMHVIDGNVEAHIIYDGIQIDLPQIERGLIMDIGGGSVEFIAFENQEMMEFKSFEMGVSRIYQDLGKPKTFSKAAKKWIDDFFEQNDIISHFQKTKILIGSSGSFETIYEAVNQSVYDKVKPVELDFDEVLDSLEWILASSLEERQANEWIVPYRVEMLPIAAYLMKKVIVTFGIEKLILSPNSLKEGVFVTNVLNNE